MVGNIILARISINKHIDREEIRKQQVDRNRDKEYLESEKKRAKKRVSMVKWVFIGW